MEQQSHTLSLSLSLLHPQKWIDRDAVNRCQHLPDYRQHHGYITYTMQHAYIEYVCTRNSKHVWNCFAYPNMYLYKGFCSCYKIIMNIDCGSHTKHRIMPVTVSAWVRDDAIPTQPCVIRYSQNTDSHTYTQPPHTHTNKPPITSNLEQVHTRIQKRLDGWIIPMDKTTSRYTYNMQNTTYYITLHGLHANIQSITSLLYCDPVQYTCTCWLEQTTYRVLTRQRKRTGTWFPTIYAMYTYTCSAVHTHVACERCMQVWEMRVCAGIKHLSKIHY